jgi:hypothetical protein
MVIANPITKGNWKGGVVKSTHGYTLIYSPGHPRAYHGRYVYEHILIAESVLGRFMPKGAEVHHVNGNVADNRKNNLVLCESRAFHKLLHKRERALKLSGHADWLACHYCGEYDPPSLMYICKNGRKHWHRYCAEKSRLASLARRKKADMDMSGSKPIWVVPS